MENPEEVLQALDEFQKMRPSEIPRELEEYLCWVAKTGDPVYQWSLVKPLFREKLTRVMTDFYESCPSLELAPCPNVEQFNYDIMKCALLELLDSFANAPFTVQRICELLTSPRKEYNRVDKFMRAIEKNILVVSTREPGPAARRSENGDGMVNGSMEDDALSSQSTHEVEMESWVKDCTTEPTVVAAAGESNAPLLDSVITGKAPKIVSTNDESLPISEDKNELPTSEADIADSHEIPSTPNLASPVVTPEAAICDTSVENSSGNGTEAASAVADVPEAAMNEDTSSQPSLDSEADDAETGASRKLQTTFQPKDFVKEAKSTKFYTDEPKEEEKASRVEADSVVEASPVTSSNSSEDSSEKSPTETKLSYGCQETVLPVVETILEKRPRSEIESNDLDTGEGPQNEPEISSPFKKACSMISESTERTEEPETTFLASLPASKTEEEPPKIVDTTETSTESSCAERLAAEENSKIETEEDESKDEAIECTDDSLPEAERAIETENSRPIIEEPSFEETGEDSTSKSPEQTTNEQPESGVTIEEAMDDDTRVNKSIIPDPIPIVEEPKEPEPTLRDPESTTIITEVTEDSKIVVETVETPAINVITETTTIEESTTVTINEAAPIVEQTTQDDITDVRSSATEAEEKIEPAESMEVDGDEAMPVFQQDEPMEQEPGDLMKS